MFIRLLCPQRFEFAVARRKEFFCVRRNRCDIAELIPYVLDGIADYIVTGPGGFRSRTMVLGGVREFFHAMNLEIICVGVGESECVLVSSVFRHIILQHRRGFFWLKRLIFQFVWGWYSVVVIALRLSWIPITLKNFDVNCALLSARTLVGIPKLATQCSMNIVAIVLATVLEAGTTFIMLEDLSIITTIYWLPNLVLGSWPRMSIKIN